jgi:hypothetical protein
MKAQDAASSRFLPLGFLFFFVRGYWSMNTTSFTAAHLPLPEWAYVPGEPADSEPDHETLWQAKALVPAQFFGHVPARHPALRYGIALNDAGYFWEAQEVLEAVWAASPQGGRERILLRACIQVANANLKLRMQRPHATARLWREALTTNKDLLSRRSNAAGDGFADRFPAARLAAVHEARLVQSRLAKTDWIALGSLA